MPKTPTTLGKEKEICICAAIVTAEGRIIRGHRHSDCLSAARDRKLDVLSTATPESQGFITSRNRYVDRIEGRKLQDAAGIDSASPEGYMRGTLFSEDLY